jgi:hypothetical protein
VIFAYKRELYRELNFSFKREPYRTKIRTVFREFKNIKNLNLMEFIRKARCAMHEKALKTAIYAVRFALLTVFVFKKPNF